MEEKQGTTLNLVLWKNVSATEGNVTEKLFSKFLGLLSQQHSIILF